MKILCYTLLLLPVVVNSVKQVDLEYVRQRLKEYNDKTNERMQREMKISNGHRPSSKAALMTQTELSPSEELSISAVNGQTELADALFQGDIMLTREQADNLVQSSQIRVKRQAAAVGPNMTLWDRTIPYTINETYQANRLDFVWDEGCWSYMGKHNMSRQELSLGDGCQTIGHSIHEIGHALGFFHTHARWDRDEYITVNIENINDTYISQFNKETKVSNDNLGLPYDYGSIMHYDQFDTATKVGFVTMKTKNALYEWTIGGYYESFYDLLMMNKLYKCDDICKEFETKCENGGYPNPNNCSQCNCPRGFGGVLCNERPKGCGETLMATSEWQQFTDTLGNGTRLYTFFECNYWIQAPKGTSLEIKLKYEGGICYGGCVYGGVEIKAQEDQRETGYRFCCNETQHVFSNHTLVPIFIYNRYYQHNATISYRIVNKNDITTTTIMIASTTPNDKDVPVPTIDTGNGKTTAADDVSPTTRGRMRGCRRRVN